VLCDLNADRAGGGKMDVAEGYPSISRWIIVLILLTILTSGANAVVTWDFNAWDKSGRDQRIGWSFRNWFTGSDPVNRLHQVPS
jgi:hypothetical protein